MDLTPEIVFSLIQSDQSFPVNFDDAITWWDAKTKTGNPVPKGDLKDKLKNNFIEEVDYEIFSEISEKIGRGRPKEGIRLTVECFKMMGMMVPGSRGRQIREYFIRAEAELKRRLEDEKLRQKHRVVKAIVSESYTGWKKRFEDVFFDEAYRITGWARPLSGHPQCMGNFINENVYDLFPEGTTEELRIVNPSRKTGGRARKHHQHLTPTIGLPLLDYQKGITIAVMRLSPSNNPKRFKSNMEKACGGAIQIELPFMDELDKAS